MEYFQQDGYSNFYDNDLTHPRLSITFKHKHFFQFLAIHPYLWE